MVKDLFDRINVTRIVTDHLKTLSAVPADVRAVTWREIRGYDIILFYFVPLGVGIAAATWWRWEIVSLSAVVGAATFLAGILLTLLFQSLTLAEKAADTLEDFDGSSSDWRRERARRRMVIVQQTYHSVAYAFLVTLGVVSLSVALQVSGSATTASPLEPVWTGILVCVSLHLLLTLVLVVNRLYVAVDTRASSQPQR